MTQMKQAIRLERQLRRDGASSVEIAEAVEEAFDWSCARERSGSVRQRRA